MNHIEFPFGGQLIAELEARKSKLYVWRIIRVFPLSPARRPLTGWSDPPVLLTAAFRDIAALGILTHGRREIAANVKAALMDSISAEAKEAGRKMTSDYIDREISILSGMRIRATARREVKELYPGPPESAR